MCVDVRGFGCSSQQTFTIETDVAITQILWQICRCVGLRWLTLASRIVRRWSFLFSLTGVPYLSQYRRDDPDAEMYHLPYEWLYCLGHTEIFALFTSTVVHCICRGGFTTFHQPFN